MNDAQSGTERLQHEAEQTAAELAAVLSTRSDALQALQVMFHVLVANVSAALAFGPCSLICTSDMQATCLDRQQQLQSKQNDYNKAAKQLQGQSQLIHAIDQEMQLVRQEMVLIHKAVDSNNVQGEVKDMAVTLTTIAIKSYPDKCVASMRHCAVKDHQHRIQQLLVSENALIGKNNSSPLAVVCIWLECDCSSAEQVQLQKRQVVKLQGKDRESVQKLAAREKEVQAGLANVQNRYIITCLWSNIPWLKSGLCASTTGHKAAQALLTDCCLFCAADFGHHNGLLYKDFAGFRPIHLHIFIPPNINIKRYLFAGLRK